jgi:dienelactone hydrolase
MRFTFLALLACIGILSTLLGDPPRDPAEPEEIAHARKFLDLLLKEDFDAAVRDFDDVMLKALPADKLKETWKGLTEQFGKVQKQGAVRIERTGKYVIVIIPFIFEKITLDAKVVFSKDGKVTGLNFAPPQGEYKAPAYVKAADFQEDKLTIGKEEWALPAILSVPNGTGPFPVIILVHGSGPMDHDETIGPNKPFRDLAGGLASRGIAVLRYDKRTLVHGKKMPKNITVKEETIDDALAAADLLRQRKEIDSKRIFVLGHSLGAMLLPRIGEADPALAGLIVVSGPARPLEDLVLEQTTYLMSQKGDLTDETKAKLAELKKQIERVKDPKLSPDTPSDQLTLGAPASYWLDLRGYQPAIVAVGLKQHLLILQGERDYQVTMEDFAIWKKQLAGLKNVELKSYPKLNHLMLASEGKSIPEEYFRADHVAQEVIEDIAAWIKKP